MTSLADGGPHLSGQLQSRWITKAESSQFMYCSEFSSHHWYDLSFSFQVSQKNNNLQLVDPDAKLMHDLFNSMVRIVPGFGFFLKKTSETTKSE